ncbi:MAG: response regulator transcription factor [Dehalococcoidales bacterium]|nr:response regulator transcription factor [Dehalococcoidales bacterium]
MSDEASVTDISVILADDHPALRIGLRVLLEQTPGVSVVAEAGDGEAALASIVELRPRVAVLDCRLPGRSGAEVAAEVRRQGLPTAVLALSAYSDDQHVLAMLDAGATGYLVKEEAPAAIVTAVRAVAGGQTWFSPAVANKAQAWARGERAGAIALTERESAVLRLLARGKSNKQIARALTVTERTVEFHVGNVLAKLDVTSRVEAAVWAKDHGLAD